jgi:dihydropteroate synthase
MEKEGADIIDIGGESTRPNAKFVKEEEEIRRVIPVIKNLNRKIKIPISIDTRKSKVAREAIEHGASMVNDISGLNWDSKMIKVIRDYKVPVVIMHIKGTPQTMQKNPKYNDVISEIYDYFLKAIEKALKNGIKKEKIIIDPGIGFGKLLKHNIEILKRLIEFKSLGYPILIGTSRKSFIGQLLNLPVDRRLNGSLASSAVSIMNGADILRVHDVRQTKELAKVIDSIIR